MTYWVSGGRLRPQRHYLSVHANPQCWTLYKRSRRDNSPVIEVPAGFERYLTPCSRCIPDGRWVLKKEVGRYDPFWDWWRDEVMPEQVPLDAELRA